MKTRRVYFIAQGWIHPKRGGDDYPFEKGYSIVTDYPIKIVAERLKIVKVIPWLSRISADTRDFEILHVSKKEWEKKYFVK